MKRAIRSLIIILILLVGYIGFLHFYISTWLQSSGVRVEHYRDTIERVDTVVRIFERKRIVSVPIREHDTLTVLVRVDSSKRYYREEFADSVVRVCIEDSVQRDSIVWRRIAASVVNREREIRDSVTVTEQRVAPLGRGNFYFRDILRPYIDATILQDYTVGVGLGVRHHHIRLGGEVFYVPHTRAFSFGVRVGWEF